MTRAVSLAITLATLGVGNAGAQALNQRSTVQPQITAGGTVVNTDAIDAVWAGHGVGFDIVSTANRLYVAYYDANRQLTLASRPRNNRASWTYHKLDSWVGWDSHNYVAIATDSEGRLHVAGNMHNDPLTYFRTETNGDVRTLQRVTTLVDAKIERSMTYPVFLKDGAGRLILKYRDGGSGNGNEIYNVYDAMADRWSALLNTPLVNGEGLRNAYFVGPVLGPDKAFHITWVWRDTPDASTNHDLSYAKSVDLVHWTRSDGTPIALPITLAKAEIVDAVPVKAGMINNNTVLGFDAAGRPLITYHKFDAAGDTQIFVARREAGGWRSVQVSRWKGFRWDFGGGGSLTSRVFVSGGVAQADGKLKVTVTRDGQGLDLILDAETLALLEERPAASLQDQLAASVPPGLSLNVLEAMGGGAAPRFAIAWSAKPPNRDLPAAEIPPPSTLRLLELR